MHGSHPGAMKRIDLWLTEGQTGEYLVRLPDGLHGEVLTQLSLSRKDAGIHRNLLLNF